MNSRQRMRTSNVYVREWLLKNKFDHVWFKPHRDPRKRGNHEVVYRANGETYGQLDLFNLFDGVCFDPNGLLVMFQVKTHNWASEKKIKDFMKGKSGFMCMVFNVRLIERRWKVFIREYR